MVNIKLVRVMLRLSGIGIIAHFNYYLDQ